MAATGRANRYDSSTGTWYAPVLIETDDTWNATGAMVAVNGSGNAVAVWGQNGIWANTYR